MPKGASNVKLIEPPLAEPHERWCERSEIPQSEEFPPTRFLIFMIFYIFRSFHACKIPFYVKFADKISKIYKFCQRRKIVMLIPLYKMTRHLLIKYNYPCQRDKTILPICHFPFHRAMKFLRQYHR